VSLLRSTTSRPRRAPSRHFLWWCLAASATCGDAGRRSCPLGSGHSPRALRRRRARQKTLLVLVQSCSFRSARRGLFALKGRSVNMIARLLLEAPERARLIFSPFGYSAVLFPILNLALPPPRPSPWATSMVAVWGSNLLLRLWRRRSTSCGLLRVLSAGPERSRARR